MNLSVSPTFPHTKKRSGLAPDGAQRKQSAISGTATRLRFCRDRPCEANPACPWPPAPSPRRSLPESSWASEQSDPSSEQYRAGPSGEREVEEKLRAISWTFLNSQMPPLEQTVPLLQTEETRPRRSTGDGNGKNPQTCERHVPISLSSQRQPSLVASPASRLNQGTQQRASYLANCILSANKSDQH